MKRRDVPAPLVVRFNLGVGAGVLTMLAVISLLQDVRAWPFVVLLLGLAVLVVTRGVRAGIEFQGDEMVLHDYVLTTRVGRAQVVSIDRFPAIDWRGHDGTPRETVVWAFARNAASTAPSDEDRAVARSIVETWLNDDGERRDCSRAID